MSVVTLLSAAIVFLAAPVAIAQQDSALIGRGASEQQDGKTTNLPVSLDRIREALAERPRDRVRWAVDEPRCFDVDEPRPHFKINVQAREPLQQLIASMDFKSGPTPAGGIYTYDQQRRLFPAVDNPLVQPYAAFNPGQLVTILVENLVGTYLAGRAVAAATSAERARAEARAREEVARAITEYCAVQTNNGAGIQICSNGGLTVR